MKPIYEIMISDEIVYIEEHVTLNGHKVCNNFRFDLHVFNRALGVDVLLGTTPLEEDENFIGLLDEYREY